jgi:hypothetical protein
LQVSLCSRICGTQSGNSGSDHGRNGRGVDYCLRPVLIPHPCMPDTIKHALAFIFICCILYPMGYSNLYVSSTLQCQDINCMQQFPNRPVLVPKMGSTGGSFAGQVFVVVRQMHICPLRVAINLARQCDRTDIHGDNKAWFGVWAAGVRPPRPSVVPTMPTFTVNPLYAATSWKQRQQCVSTNCKGFTANGCPYRLCASHCRLVGGCSKHKLPTTIHPQHAPPNAS